MSFYKNHEQELKSIVSQIVPSFQKLLKEKGNTYLVEYVYGWTDSLQNASGLKEKITCSKQKCSWCCHSTIGISHAEAQYIKLQIDLNGIKPNEERSKLQNDINMSAQNERLLKWVDRACPFLTSTDGQGECSIYEIRPLLCRNHNSVAENWQDCNREDDPNKSIPDGRMILLEAIQIALIEVSKKENEYLIPIHTIK